MFKKNQYILSVITFITLILFYCDHKLEPQGTYIKVISPNGGENWIMGSKHEITWQSKDVINIQIKYSVNNGDSWHWIIEGGSYPASKNSYLWTVPKIITEEAKIRIYDSSTNIEIVDESDDCFTIVGNEQFYNSLKYYPLTVTNKWVYKSKLSYYSYDPTERFTTTYLTVIEAIKDTIIGNNKKYIKLITYTNDNKTKTGYFRAVDYQRVDSTSCKVFRFDLVYPGDDEYLVDYLLAAPRIGVKSHRFETWKPRWAYFTGTFVISERDTTIFNIQTKSKSYSEQYYWGRDNYLLTQNIGLCYHYHYDEYDTIYDTLKGCVINSIVYGDTSFYIKNDLSGKN